MDFLSKKGLAQLGYRFDPDDLGGFEVEYLTLIAVEFAKLEATELKNAMKKRGRK